MESRLVPGQNPGQDRDKDTRENGKPLVPGQNPGEDRDKFARRRLVPVQVRTHVQQRKITPGQIRDISGTNHATEPEARLQMVPDGPSFSHLIASRSPTQLRLASPRSHARTKQNDFPVGLISPNLQSISKRVPSDGHCLVICCGM